MGNGAGMDGCVDFGALAAGVELAGMGVEDAKERASRIERKLEWLVDFVTAAKEPAA